MKVRERTEQIEYEILSPYAAKSAASKRDKVCKPCPFRTDFQRDRDRILHSKSFRRLKHKTQVYIMSGDHYRTRLTHSLEVAQIARTIARGLRLNEDLTEAIAMGHDVGHTPFGHVGEAALSDLIGHFAHNEQSLRVVEYLERNGEGLNLTTAVRDGIVNHTGPHLPFTLEGCVVRISDRIAYLCHDYDDSIRAGLLRHEDLPQVVKERLGAGHSQMITAMVADIILASEGKNRIVQSEQVKNAMDTFRRFMFANIYHSKALAKEREQARFVLTELYNYFCKNPDKLPRDFLERGERWGHQQTVVDYVAGLTDSYAVQIFQEIFVPPVGFVKS